ncbi:MAG TPA: hypothetical protein VEI04_00630 [Syntrophobacteria bacterium]|nr:hypothetical protein [Syntrophobacteria bacterium]
MSKVKWCFCYKSPTPDVLRERFSLLAEMATDPVFPFGKQDLFENLADQIESLYVRYLETEVKLQVVAK